MNTEEMLIKAAAFAGYAESGYNDNQVFVVAMNARGWKSWNPLLDASASAELITQGKFSVQGTDDTAITVSGTHLSGSNQLEVHIVIVERAPINDPRVSGYTSRLAITKMAVTMFDLRGAE